MKQAPLSFKEQTPVCPSFSNPARRKAFTSQSDYRKQWFFRAKLNRGLASGFSLLASLTVAISLSGTLDTALAADGPKAGIAKSSQGDSIEVPGSFKDLPDARDAVTAKRLPEDIRLPASTDGPSNQLVIDQEKVPGTGGWSAGERAIAPNETYDEGDLVDFHATAYCLKGRTASGIDTRPGMIAADPRVLPLGTVVHLRSGRYTGTYTVMDTGGRIKGRIVDVYVRTHREAIEFGRRQVKIKVISRSSVKDRRDRKNLMALER